MIFGWRVNQKKERKKDHAPNLTHTGARWWTCFNNGCLMYYISLKIVQMSGTKFLPQILSALVNHRQRRLVQLLRSSKPTVQHTYTCSSMHKVKQWVKLNLKSIAS